MKILFPDYKNSLTNVTNSLLKYYGFAPYHETLKEVDDYLLEKEYQNIVVILYDGMGSILLNRNLEKDSFLNRNKVKDIHAVFPPTTTASTTSVLSGLNPNEHGWLGWDLYFKKIDKTVTMFLNTLKDTNQKVSETSISEETYPYENMIQKIGTKVNAVGLFPFKDTYYQDMEDMHRQIEEICKNGQKNFIYAYYENPDSIMHRTGTSSEETLKTFEEINDKTEALCQKLQNTLVIILADHGHINSEVITLKDYPDLFDCLERDISIESRACSFKVKNKEKFQELFLKYFKEDFLLFTKEEVLEKQLFGTGKNNEHFEEVIGDFLAVAISDKYFRYDEKGKVFKSMHAGITEEEVLVPLIIVRS